jgi:hypothetical protein
MKKIKISVPPHIKALIDAAWRNYEEEMKRIAPASSALSWPSKYEMEKTSEEAALAAEVLMLSLEGIKRMMEREKARTSAESNVLVATDVNLKKIE